MPALTRRQRAIYEFIVGQIQAEGIPPTLMEIANAFGLSSAAGVADHLKAIERKGYIRRRPGTSRGIEVAAHRQRAPRARSVQVPLRGDVPSARGWRSRVRDHLLVDGRLAGDASFGLRLTSSGLERRGLLAGDVLLVQRADPLPGDLLVGTQGTQVLLLEFAASGAGARPVAGRLDSAHGVRVRGRVIGVLRGMGEWRD